MDHPAWAQSECALRGRRCSRIVLPFVPIDKLSAFSVSCSALPTGTIRGKHCSVRSCPVDILGGCCMYIAERCACSGPPCVGEPWFSVILRVQVPYTLRADISWNICQDQLSRVPIFRQTDSGFMAMLGMQLQPEYFLCGDWAAKAGASRCRKVGAEARRSSCV